MLCGGHGQLSSVSARDSLSTNLSANLRSLSTRAKSPACCALARWNCGPSLPSKMHTVTLASSCWCPVSRRTFAHSHAVRSCPRNSCIPLSLPPPSGGDSQALRRPPSSKQSYLNTLSLLPYPLFPTQRGTDNGTRAQRGQMAKEPRWPAHYVPYLRSKLPTGLLKRYKECPLHTALF